MSVKIQVKRSIASSWTSANPTLDAGEIGFETDTGYFKIGNGSSAWNSLPYTISQNLNSSASPTFAGLTTSGNVVVGGNLTVNGNSTILNTETLTVEDNIIVLNSNVIGAPSLNAGIEVERGSSANAVLRWNETTDTWQVTENGTDYYDIINTNSLETRFADEHWHKSVRFATTAVLPNSPTYTAGSLDLDGGYGIGAKLESSTNARLSVDGTEVVTGNRILVKNQANALHNGIYDVTAQGSASAHWILTRSADANGSYADQIDKGETVGVQEGVDNYYQQFYVSSTGTGTDGAHIIGTDNITFVQYSGVAQFIPGDGLAVSGNTLNVVSESSARILVNSNSIDLAAIVQSDTSACPGISFVSSITRDGYGRVTGVSTGDVLVELGTNTSGSYVASLVAGTGVGLANNSGENATPTISIGQDVGTSASVTFAQVNAPVTGNVTGNASTASTLQNARTISLSGDVSGSASFNGSSDITISATVQPNSVALGTDTTGNYVSGVTAGTGITVTHTPAEGSSPTIAVTANTYDTYGSAAAAQSAAQSYADSAISATNLDGLNNVTVPSPTSGDYLKWNGTAWVNDPINLGTDTTGNYMSDLTQGTGVTITHTPGEGSNATIAIGQAVATSDSPTFAGLNLNGNIIFEGTTADNFETTLSVVDPTADRTITLPNVSGTVVTTGDTGTVTSTMIADGTIVNGDINASAGIALSKLATSTAGNIIVYNASGVPTAVAETGDVTISDLGVTAISSGVIVNADINASAGIELSKLATSTAGNIIVYNSSGVPTAVAETGDVTISDTGVTAIASGVIVNADVNASAAIAHSKLANATAGQVLLGTTTTGVVTATTISGDITIDGAGVATIAANSVALGTDTTGNYVATITGGTGVTSSAATSGEGTTHTLSIGQSVATSASVTFGQVTTTGNVVIGGNLQVSGSVQTVNQTSLELDDPFIYLNTTASVSGIDTGVVASYYDGSHKHSGYFRDATDGKFKFFDSYTPEPANPINIADGSYSAAPVVAEYFESTIATGTAPLAVTSTTVVTNLNADYLDGQHGSYYAPIDSPTFTGTVTLPTGTVTSGMILDGTIANADISSSAAIALSKLASGTSGQIIVANSSGVPTWVSETGDITISDTGVTAIASGVIVNADVNASAAIDYSKLAALTSGNILVGNASNVATSTAVSGDITISNAGVTAISAGVIVNADINASAAIAHSKLAGGGVGQVLLGATTTGTITATTLSGDITIDGGGVTAISAGVVTNADISASAAIAYSKLANITAGSVLLGNASNIPTVTALSGDVTVNSSGVTAIASGVVVNADISASAGIELSKLATSTAGNIIVYNSSGVPTAVAETGDVTISDTGVTAIASGVIVNADISSTAAIELGKLADVSTNAQVASYTLVLADKNKVVEIANGSANTLTVPPNSSVAFPVGSQITFIQTGAGQTTITPGAGVTINGTPGLKLRAQWSSATLIKRATDTWVALGDLSA
jgi:hypothetical protein